MTEVQRIDFYEWPFQNDKATCEECDKEMDVPDMEDPNRDMEEPFWLRFDNVFKSYCEKHWSERLFD